MTDNTPTISFQGETHTLYEWSQERGIHFSTMYYRFQSGCSVEEVLGLDIKPWCPKRKISMPQVENPPPVQTPPVQTPPVQQSAPSRRLKPKKLIDSRMFEMIPFADVERPLAHWAELLGISRALLLHRVKKFGGSTGFVQAIVSLFCERRLRLSRITSALGLHYAAVYRRFQKVGCNPRRLGEVLRTPNHEGRILAHRGIELPVAKWAQYLNIPIRTINARLKKYGDSPSAMAFVLYPNKLTNPQLTGRAKL